MKISDIEFQGDGSKATFYYTANDRIDFRLLIKDFAKEFSTRIEMKQVGFRQEAARLGIGSCGRSVLFHLVDRL
jgi:cell fate regulator YaaT (PSP1 superfamily)